MFRSMSERLRRSYEYSNTHRTFDLSVMREAADHIERLEEELSGLRKEYREMARSVQEAIRDGREEPALRARIRLSGGISHFLPDGTQVYTLDEAEQISGLRAQTLRQRMHRAEVEPAGHINPRVPVYTAVQLGWAPAPEAKPA